MPLHIKTDFCSHAQTWNASVHTTLTDSGGRFCLFLPADETAVHLSFWSQKAVFVYNGPVLHFFLPIEVVKKSTQGSEGREKKSADKASVYEYSKLLLHQEFTLEADQQLNRTLMKKTENLRVPSRWQPAVSHFLLLFGEHLIPV